MSTIWIEKSQWVATCAGLMAYYNSIRHVFYRSGTENTRKQHDDAIVRFVNALAKGNAKQYNADYGIKKRVKPEKISLSDVGDRVGDLISLLQVIKFLRCSGYNSNLGKETSAMLLQIVAELAIEVFNQRLPEYNMALWTIR